ncbi:hypothetical protein GF322_03830 [Candidatus Dependentiae bacterium]|nr:hypothetical protein [Candidatus Dependentiae bacterium]
MKMKIYMFIFISLIFLFPSCVKKSSISKYQKEQSFTLKPFEKTLLEKEKTLEELDEQREKIDEKIIQPEKKPLKPSTQIKESTLEPKTKITAKYNQGELDFYVQNMTGKTIYVVCFSYIQKQHFNRWRWDKSKIYKLKNNQIKKIDVDYIKDEKYRKNVYGYLAIFDNEEEASSAIYELLKDKNKIPLDQLHKLKNQKVLIEIEKYGFKGEQLQHDIVPFNDSEIKFPELDFVVENQTGKTILVTCFVYQRKDDAHIWRYDKTPIIKLHPNDYGLIDIDEIKEKYVRVYMQGFLAIFDENELEKAKNATFELLPAENKVPIGRIVALKNKKIVLEVEKYGIIGPQIDFTIKSLQRIDFKKALN